MLVWVVVVSSSKILKEGEVWKGFVEAVELEHLWRAE